MKTESDAVHAGRQIDRATAAIVPAIHPSTTFERDPYDMYPMGFGYARENNPNRASLEEALAVLEGGWQAAAFPSGSAATLAVLQALQSGDHIIVSQDIYYGIRLIVEQIFGRWGLAASFVDMTDTTAIENAFIATSKLVLIETPSNPLLKITDIKQVAELAHAHGALLACDNTIATPLLQRPFDFDADLIIHSSTKYLAGHSDVMGGVVISREESEFFERVRFIQTVGGVIPSPFDCWMIQRGLQTLPARLQVQATNALKIATFLEGHPQVESVLYPGLTNHPQYQTIRQQMLGYGALMSFLIKGDVSAALFTASRVKLFTRATSFGGTHSLIEHRASIEAEGTTTPQNLLRLSIGLENSDDLIHDLDQALS